MGLLGLRVLMADEPISVRGLLAFTVAGIGLGVLLMGFTAGRARRWGRTVPAPGSENMGAFVLLLGLVNVGWGLEPALQANPTPWSWLALLFSVTGGTFLGIALVLGGMVRTGGPEPEVAGRQLPGRL